MFRLFVAVFCTLTSIASASQQNQMSPELSKLVDTGVIFSAEQVRRSVEMVPMIGVTAPFWTPTPDEIARLEGRLGPYLFEVANHQAKAVAVQLASYKRQYLGYSDGGRKWILVNAFCDKYWKDNGSWRDRFVFVLDGGPCFFRVRHELSGSEFEQLEINGQS